MSKLGTIIAELRREAGYTQKTLAEALNITDKAVSKWERGLSLPDVSLLLKLSLLLDADIEFLLSNHKLRKAKNWVGVLDLSAYPDIDLSQKVYDKPMVYYMLIHFLLLSIKNICVLTTQKNKNYLENSTFQSIGFNFCFDIEDVRQQNLMIMNRPCFLFGSDLTHQFEGAMVSDTIMKLVPEGVAPTFLFCPAEYYDIYTKNSQYLYEIASVKSLGRGMICMDMDSDDMIAELATFIKMYQNNTGLKIADLSGIVNSFGLPNE